MLAYTYKLMISYSYKIYIHTLFKYGIIKQTIYQLLISDNASKLLYHKGYQFSQRLCLLALLFV